MRNTVDWTDIAGYNNLTKELVETAYNESIGGDYFDIGTHQVIVESLEPRISTNGNPFVSVTFEGSKGQRIKKAVMLKDKEGKKVPFVLRQLLHATIADKQLRIKAFAEVFNKAPQLLDCLRGMQMSIVVEEGKNGYKMVKSTMEDGYQLIDVETGNFYEDIGDKAFDSYAAAKEEAEEKGYKRMFLEATKILPTSEEQVLKNEEVIRRVILDFEEANSSPTGVKSAARRPAL